MDRLYGGVTADPTETDTGNDTLVGGSSDDKLYGQDGNDLLEGGKGADFIDGGAGTNTADKDVLDSDINIEKFI